MPVSKAKESRYISVAKLLKFKVIFSEQNICLGVLNLMNVESSFLEHCGSQRMGPS